MNKNKSRNPNPRVQTPLGAIFSPMKMAIANATK